jgi:Na+/H+ antiporter NhaD/arsenite permease-like protein
MTDILVVLSLAAIAIGRIPSLRMNRATIALVGATLLVLSGGLSLEEAYRAIDANTIVLLFAMMAFNANLRMAGFFALAGQVLRRSARGPKTLLLYVMALSALLSALLINDTAVLMLSPLVLDLALGAGLNPLPYIIGLALSANIGSMATIIGNPQNILIGTSSGIGFFEFSAALLPPALLLLGLAYLILLALYPKDFRQRSFEAFPPGRVFLYKPLLVKCAAAFALMAGALLLGLPVSLAGMAGASLLLITRRIHPERVFMDVDWSLLVLFPSLFVITRAAADSWLFAQFYAMVELPMSSSMALLGLFSAGLSQFISNVPAVMLLMPLVERLPDARTGWLVLAGCTTVAGNLTLLGSVANLIVAELSQKRGVTLGFWAYLKAGLPVSLISVALTLLWLLAPR